MILISHPTGNANVKAVVKSLIATKIIFKYITSIAVFKGFVSNLSSRLSVLKNVKRRQLDEEFKPYTITFPLKESLRLFCTAAKLKRFIQHEKGILSIDHICHTIDEKAALVLKKNKKNISAVYAYEDCALRTFQQAKKLNKICLYDLPIGYYKAARALMQADIEKRPDWAATFTGFKDSESKLQRKDQEIALADEIFVASSFTAYTLEKFYTEPLPPIKIIPYGFPDIGMEKVYDYDGERPLRLLFVGGLSQRKGIADLLEAVEYLSDKITLTIIGRKPTNDCIPLNEGLKKHRWIESLSHQDILKEMQLHDVLVFPSLFEGFGLVITEAMAQGTPVITTNRTIGGDIIQTGVNGWLVEPGNAVLLKDCVHQLLKNPEEVKKNGILARETAKRRPWKSYETDMGDLLHTFTI